MFSFQWLLTRLCFLLFIQIHLFAQPVTSVLRVGMTVSDMGRALAFYQNVLDFQKGSDVEIYGSEVEQLLGVFGARIRVVQLHMGKETVELTDFLAPEGRPVPVDSRSNDLWFQHIAIVVSDMEKAYERLRQHRVQHVSTAPQRIPDWNTAAAGVEAFYFQDPDGHNLELISFPPGKGDARWQEKNRLFLGVDHTAIGVDGTAERLPFYRDVLGLKVAGDSENYGTEQEHLNNVFGAHLLITGLRSGGGPGIEFLDYLSPANGREYPPDARSNDLLHWQTTLAVNNLALLLPTLRAAGAELISSGITKIPGDALGFEKGLLLRDPDGHALLLVEQSESARQGQVRR